MSNSYIKLIWLSVLLLFSVPLPGQEVYDSAYVRRVKDSVDRYFRKHPARAVSEKDGKFDVFPVYGVMYSQERQLTAMGGFIGSFRTSSDTLVPLSQLGVIAAFSTNLYVAGAVAGSVFSDSGKFLFTWSAKFNNSPTKFWGLGYDNASSGNILGTFTERRLRLRTDYLYRHSAKFMVGGIAGYHYYEAARLSDSALLAGQPERTDYLFAGARLDIDTRNDMFSPSEGVFLNVEQSVWFSAVGKGRFSKTSLIADFYFPGWEGAVFAIDLAGELNSSDAPWTLWPEIGGDERMRGYYLGRYRERNYVSAQAELRQRVYKWHGIAVWGGAGNLFPSFREFKINNTLPTYGAGYRFTFYSLVFRLDFAFGINRQWAVIAGFNHSF